MKPRHVLVALLLIGFALLVVLGHKPKQIVTAQSGSAAVVADLRPSYDEAFKVALQPHVDQYLASVQHWNATVAENATKRKKRVTRRQTPPETSTAASEPVSGDTIGNSGDRFDRLAMCESTMNPQAVSATGKYRGAFQFSLSSWHSAGMTGDPIDYDYTTQKQTAIHWASITTPSKQWPNCWLATA